MAELHYHPRRASLFASYHERDSPRHSSNRHRSSKQRTRHSEGGSSSSSSNTAAFDPYHEPDLISPRTTTVFTEPTPPPTKYHKEPVIPPKRTRESYDAEIASLLSENASLRSRLAVVQQAQMAQEEGHTTVVSKGAVVCVVVLYCIVIPTLSPLQLFKLFSVLFVVGCIFHTRGEGIRKWLQDGGDKEILAFLVRTKENARVMVARIAEKRKKTAAGAFGGAGADRQKRKGGKTTLEMEAGGKKVGVEGPAALLARYQSLLQSWLMPQGVAKGEGDKKVDLKMGEAKLEAGVGKDGGEVKVKVGGKTVGKMAARR